MSGTISAGKSIAIAFGERRELLGQRVDIALVLQYDSHNGSAHFGRGHTVVEMPMRLLWSLLLTLVVIPTSVAQELEPRRWSHLPLDSNFLGAGYAYTEGDIAFDPVLRIDDATMRVGTWALRYIRTLELFARSARVDVGLGYQEGRWSGLLDGVPASVTRSGLMDSVVRFAVNLYGAPPLKGREYAAYRASIQDETIVGAALAVHLPTGEYMDDKLINLGSNRYTIRPQLGVVRQLHQWTMELTGDVWFFTDNDSFYNGNELKQDPLYTIQGHVDYRFRPGLWASAGVGYGSGARSSINGVSKDDRRENFAWALSAGYPISRRLGIKLSYIGFRTWESVGTDSDTFAGVLSTFW